MNLFLYCAVSAAMIVAMLIIVKIIKKI